MAQHGVVETSGAQAAADVVVIGFGIAGAAAAVTAARLGARVVVVGAPRAEGELQARAREAGVEVLAGLACELAVEDGRIARVGYTVDASRGAAGLGELATGSVVLAVGPRHWEWVGPAVWSVVRGDRTARSRPARLTVVDSEPEPPDPELAVRRWCACCEQGPEAAGAQAPLLLDATTALLSAGPERPVPGLYSAVEPRPTAPPPDPARLLVAGRRAGRGAARGPAPRAVLRRMG